MNGCNEAEHHTEEGDQQVLAENGHLVSPVGQVAGYEHHVDSLGEEYGDGVADLLAGLAGDEEVEGGEVVDDDAGHDDGGHVEGTAATHPDGVLH